jgi:hypothetical protein
MAQGEFRHEQQPAAFQPRFVHPRRLVRVQDKDSAGASFDGRRILVAKQPPLPAADVPQL